MNDLDINFDEYLILDRMLFTSKSKRYSEGVTALAKHLGYERATIYKYLRSLTSKGLVEHSGFAEPYLLDYKVHESFDKKEGRYIKIYHALRKELNISVKSFVLLYLVYSLSRNVKSKTALAGVKMYCSTAQISESYYNNIKQNFLNRGLLADSGSHHLKLHSHVFDWFNITEQLQVKKSV